MKEIFCSMHLPNLRLLNVLFRSLEHEAVSIDFVPALLIPFLDKHEELRHLSLSFTGSLGFPLKALAGLWTTNLLSIDFGCFCGLDANDISSLLGRNKSLEQLSLQPSHEGTRSTDSWRPKPAFVSLSPSSQGPVTLRCGMASTLHLGHCIRFVEHLRILIGPGHRIRFNDAMVVEEFWSHLKCFDLVLSAESTMAQLKQDLGALLRRMPNLDELGVILPSCSSITGSVRIITLAKVVSPSSIASQISIQGLFTLFLHDFSSTTCAFCETVVRCLQFDIQTQWDPIPLKKRSRSVGPFQPAYVTSHGKGDDGLRNLLFEGRRVERL